MPFFIAFVDDTVMLRMSVSNLLGQIQPKYKVYQYCDGKDLQERLPNENYKPDIFLMDICMPYVNGYDATIWAKQCFPNTPVLAFTMLNNDTALLKMYNCGASGFVTKNSHPDTLVEAIEEVSKGNFYCNINTEYKVVKNVLYKNNQAVRPSKPLTEHETEVLRLLTTEMSCKEIAQKLGVGLRTVETHKHNISMKLDIHTRQGLFLYAVDMGLMQM
jgi:DNA-binding NarL/FixJ family response regulator